MMSNCDVSAVRCVLIEGMFSALNPQNDNYDQR